MDIFTEYRSDYEDLVEAAWRAYTARPIPSTKGHIRAIGRCISADLYGQLEEEDFRQQLAMLWTDYYAQYVQNKPNSRLRSYLLRRSVWGLRDWLQGIGHETDEIGRYDPATSSWDFSWITTTDLPLTKWEKYLIYLKYGQEKSINEIAEILQKDRKTIRTRLEEIFGQLRSHYGNA